MLRAYRPRSARAVPAEPPRGPESLPAPMRGSRGLRRLLTTPSHSCYASNASGRFGECPSVVRRTQMTTANAAVDEDAILSMLNGETPGMPPMIDVPGAAAQPRDAELTVRPQAQPSATQAADKIHSLAAGGTGYRVDVRGEYFANNPEGKGKIKRNYELSFNVAKAEGALSVIKAKLLLPALKKKHPDAVRHRTCYVVRVTPRSAGTPKSNNLAYMDREQLEQYVGFANVTVDLTNYPKTDEGTTQLRESIIDFVQNPDSQARDEKGDLIVRPGSSGSFLARERERQTKWSSDRELAELNPDLEL